MRIDYIIIISIFSDLMNCFDKLNQSYIEMDTSQVLSTNKITQTILESKAIIFLLSENSLKGKKKIQ